MPAGGDQLYNDAVFSGPALKGWDASLSRTDTAAKAHLPFTQAMQDEAEEFYVSHYLVHFSQVRVCCWGDAWCSKRASGNGLERVCGVLRVLPWCICPSRSAPCPCAVGFIFNLCQPLPRFASLPQPLYADALATIPSLNTWDDHDIVGRCGRQEWVANRRENVGAPRLTNHRCQCTIEA